MTFSAAARLRLGSSDRFRDVWSSGPVAIFEVGALPDQPMPAELVTANVALQARLHRATDEHLRLAVDATNYCEVVFAVAYSPKWRVRVDGRSVATYRLANGQLAADVPAGHHAIRVDFRRDLADYAGPVLTLATLVALVTRRRRGRVGVG